MQENNDIVLNFPEDSGLNIGDAVMSNVDGVTAYVDTSNVWSLIVSIPSINDGEESNEVIRIVQSSPWKIVTSRRNYIIVSSESSQGYGIVIFNMWMEQLQAVVQSDRAAAVYRTNPQMGFQALKSLRF